MADPARRWAGAARYDGGTLAYLAARKLSDDVNELGVIAHGPDSAELATHTTDLLHRGITSDPANPPSPPTGLSAPPISAPPAHASRDHTR